MPPRSVRRARREKSRALAGYIVTWDVDSGNLLQCTRVRRFIFGHTVSTNGKTYHYPGFVELDGVRTWVSRCCLWTGSSWILCGDSSGRTQSNTSFPRPRWGESCRTEQWGSGTVRLVLYSTE